MMMIARQWKDSGTAGRFVVMTLLACLLMLPGLSQTLEIPGVEACQGEAASVSVIAHDINNVGAITLYVDFKLADAHYDSLISVHPQLQLASYNFFADTIAGEGIGHIALSWSALTAINLNNDTLISFSLIPLSDTTAITLGLSSELADQTGTPIQSSFIDGLLVQRANPVILEAPFTAYLFFGYLELNVLAEHAEAYQWQYLNDTVWTDLVDFAGFSGEETETLTITSLPDGVYLMQVRCAVIGCDSIHTEPTQVFIEIGIEEPQRVPAEVIIGTGKELVSIKPQGRLAGSGFDYSLWSLAGKEIMQGSARGSFEFGTSRIPAGNYILLLLFGDDSSSKIKKQITILH